MICLILPRLLPTISVPISATSSQLDMLVSAHGSAMRPLNAPYGRSGGVTGPPTFDGGASRYYYRDRLKIGP